MAPTKDRQGKRGSGPAHQTSRGEPQSLAAQINKIGAAAGVPLRYEHTSVARWVNLGMISRGRTPEFLAAALGERLGRAVSVDEIGMYCRSGGNPDMGLDFARDPSMPSASPPPTGEPWTAPRQLISNGFAIAAFGTPVTRWLAKPTDAPTAHEGGRQVGRSDLDELWKAADEARLWDSRFGGGNWKASSVTECLRLNAAPLLTGTYTETIGRELFAATAELSRVVGWSAVDTGHHDVAQRHFVQDGVSFGLFDSLVSWGLSSGWCLMSCGSCSSGWCRPLRRGRRAVAGGGTATAKFWRRSSSWRRRAALGGSCRRRSGPRGRRPTGGSPSGARPGCGPSSTVWSWTNWAGAVTLTGPGARSTR